MAAAGALAAGHCALTAPEVGAAAACGICFSNPSGGVTAARRRRLHFLPADSYLLHRLTGPPQLFGTPTAQSGSAWGVAAAAARRLHRAHRQPPQRHPHIAASVGSTAQLRTLCWKAPAAVRAAWHMCTAGACSTGSAMRQTQASAAPAVLRCGCRLDWLLACGCRRCGGSACSSSLSRRRARARP